MIGAPGTSIIGKRHGNRKKIKASSGVWGGKFTSLGRQYNREADYAENDLIGFQIYVENRVESHTGLKRHSEANRRGREK